MTKHYARFLSAFFCGTLALGFAANALTPDKEFSDIENRALTQKPQATLDSILSGQFMADYETYTIDQFVARDSWVAAKAWSERLVGKKENNGIYFCDDGSLISRFDAPEEKKLTSAANYITKFAEKAGVPVTFGLIPTQAYVWADKLPAGAPNADQKAVYDQMAALLGGTVNMADTFWTNLPAHKSEDIFYRTDHHWTSLGAYYGYVSVMEALGRGDEVIPLSAYEKTTVSTEFYGTVFSTSGVRWVEPDVMDVYVPDTGITVTTQGFDANGNPTEEPRRLYDVSYLDKKDKYSMFLGGQQSLGIVRTGNTDKPKLLLVRDSYTDSMVPFLTPHFSEIHLIDLRYYKRSTAEYIKENSIDQAMILYSVPNFTESNLAFLSR